MLPQHSRCAPANGARAALADSRPRPPTWGSGVASGAQFSVFVLAAFYRQLPVELEEAARLDGAGEWRTFRSVMLPLVPPAAAACAI
ncbi:MAG: ABC transporter permease subunit, partial [Spirochaetaceae bacterium]|nr:ABC transporter permease subunit [Spirochaetaceae bacterium]